MKMNKPAIALAIFGLAGAGSALAADGTITFQGKITDQTCDITTSGGDFTVTLPTVSAKTLAKTGNVAGRTPFTIDLNNCPEKSKVTAHFEPGSSVDQSTGRLDLQAPSADKAAKNVQIQLRDGNGEFLAVRGKPTAQDSSLWVETGSSGTAQLRYSAEYYATGAASAGDVLTSVQYTIVYQ